MDKVEVVIIDDEPIAIKIIISHLEKLDTFLVKKTFTNAIEAISFLAQNKVGLLFLDIEMPGINGLEFYKSLVNPPKTIFTTAHRNYAVDAFDLDVVDYLLKPISFDRFLKAVNRFFDQKNELVKQNETPELSITIKADKKTYKISQKDILYIEGLDDYLKIHTTSTSIISYYRMHQILDILSDSFVQIHRSYIINKKFVTAFTAAHVEMDNMKLPIGRTYRTKMNF